MANNDTNLAPLFDQPHGSAGQRDANNPPDARPPVAPQLGFDDLLQRDDILAAVVNGSADSIYVKDAAGRYIFVNAACANFVGRPAEVIVGLVDDDMFVPETARLFRAIDQRVIETGQPQQYEDSSPDPGGEIRTYLTTKTPLLDRAGAIRGVIGISRDITERRRAEEARRNAQAAETANRAKTRFLSRMSHELRTPLNVVLGFAQLLEMEDLKPDHRESVEYILDAARRLLTLVNEVLDVSQFTEGAVDLTLLPTPVAPLLADLLTQTLPLAQSRNVELAADSSGCEGLEVLADATRLGQALLNLLSNAINFNHDGGSVHISCELRAVADGAAGRPRHEGGIVVTVGDVHAPGADRAAAPPHPVGYLRIFIQDTGSGIPAELQAQLFTPFERLGADEAGISGAGLGLVASKLMIEAMGGSIGFSSTSGSGSTFWIELPLAQ